MPFRPVFSGWVLSNGSYAVSNPACLGGGVPVDTYAAVRSHAVTDIARSQ
jgi:hypothetical protein